MNNPKRELAVNTRPASALLVTMEDQTRMIQIGEVMAASGFFPAIKDGAQAAIKIMAGAELGLTPIQAVNGIDIIALPGRPPRMRPNADVTKVLLERHGYRWEIIQMDASGCTLRFFRNGQRLNPDISYTVEDARRAGLVRDGGAWKSWPANMCFARCITQGAKFLAPDCFSGAPMEVVTPEEVEREPLHQPVRAAMMIAAREKGLSDQQRHELSGGESWGEEGPLTNADGMAILAQIDGQTVNVETGEVVEGQITEATHPELFTPADPVAEPVTPEEWDRVGIVANTGPGGDGKASKPYKFAEQPELTPEQEAQREYRATSDEGFVCDYVFPDGEPCARADTHSKGHGRAAKKASA